MLLRSREWIDLFPWLRLLRVLRVAGSPPLLMLTAIVLAIWLAGQWTIFGLTDRQPMRPDLQDNQNRVGVVAEQVATSRWTDLAQWADLARWTDLARWADLDQITWSHVGLAMWTILIWGPLFLLLARQGGLLTAGRRLMPLGQGVRLAMRRTPASWLTTLIPFLCLIPFMLAAMLVGGISSWLPNFQPFQVLVGLFVALVTLPCGLLAFGAVFAIPISWAALTNERDADPLDSLSRGYEYLFRRPVPLIFYLLISAVLVFIIGGLATGAASFAAAIATATLSSVHAAEESIAMAVSTLNRVADVVAITLAMSLVGGTYLLLRHDAGNQEVEDLWETPPVQRPALPELPKQQ